MNRKTREGIWGTEEEIYKETSVSNTGSRQKNEDRSRYIRLYNKRDTIYRV